MKGPLYDIVEKPEFISFKAVQETIRVAHESNTEKGLLYATASQSVDTLKKKIGDGVCYVALDRATGSVVGTVTLGIRPLHYWYVNEIVAIIKLLAVHPDYKGGGISKALVDHCIFAAYLLMLIAARESLTLQMLTQMIGKVKKLLHRDT